MPFTAIDSSLDKADSLTWPRPQKRDVEICGMWKQCENVGKSWDEDFPGFSLFFFQDSCAFLIVSLLQGLSKDSPKPKLCMLCSSVPCLQVPRHAPGQAYQTTQGVRWMDSAKESKRIKKNQQDAKSSLWVRLDSWSAFFDDLRCILYRLHTSKKTTWVLGHISNLSARTSTTWGDLACVTSSTWLLHAYTWIPWIYLAQARPEPVPNLRGCILSNVTSNIYVNIYMHEYRKIIYECNMQCNIASTHQPMHAALKEYEGIKPQMGATMSQTMSAY